MWRETEASPRQKTKLCSSTRCEIHQIWGCWFEPNNSWWWWTHFYQNLQISGWYAKLCWFMILKIMTPLNVGSKVLKVHLRFESTSSLQMELRIHTRRLLMKGWFSAFYFTMVVKHGAWVNSNSIVCTFSITAAGIAAGCVQVRIRHQGPIRVHDSDSLHCPAARN